MKFTTTIRLVVSGQNLQLVPGNNLNPAYGARWWLAPRYMEVPADFVQPYGHLYNDGYLIPSLDLVFVRLGRGEKFPPGFQADLVKKVLAAVEK